MEQFLLSTLTSGIEIVIDLSFKYLIHRMTISDYSKTIGRKLNHSTLLKKGVTAHCSNKLSCFKKEICCIYF